MGSLRIHQLFYEGVTVKRKKTESPALESTAAETAAESGNGQELALEAERARRRKKLRHYKRMRFWDRVAGFIIVTVLVVGCFCLGLEYVIVKGPSPALRDMFITTMNETRRFRFIPRLFLTEAEMAELTKKEEAPTDIQADESLITIAAHEEIGSGEGDSHTDAYGLVDEDGDGILLLDVKGNGYMGYMTVVLDPKRVFVGMPDAYGGIGLTLEEMVKKYNAIGGINAGGFKDDGGGGLGGIPEGLTIIDGQCYNSNADTTEGFAGLDKNGILHVGFYTLEECQEKGIVNAVSFGPILISNGMPADPPSSSVNPRTAIGQRADGAILMLVIDGRQVHSTGATYQDMTDIMLDYGAVNAINMDGGSSTVMYYKDHYVNSCSAENGQPRPLPDAWLYK